MKSKISDLIANDIIHHGMEDTTTGNYVESFDMYIQEFDEDSQNADDEKLSEQAAFENLQEATKNIMGSLEKAVDYYDSLLETVKTVLQLG